MSYTPHTWESGETVTAEKLNNLEEGASGGGSLLVTVTVEEDTPSSHSTTYTMDKTWQEIHDALLAGSYVCGIYENNGYTGQEQIDHCSFDGDSYRAYFGADDEGYTTDSPDGYPSYVSSVPV